MRNFGIVEGIFAGIIITASKIRARLIVDVQTVRNVRNGDAVAAELTHSQTYICLRTCYKQHFLEVHILPLLQIEVGIGCGVVHKILVGAGRVFKLTREGVICTVERDIQRGEVPAAQGKTVFAVRGDIYLARKLHHGVARIARLPDFAVAVLYAVGVVGNGD